GDFEKGKTLQFLHDSKLDPQRVVIEVTEHKQTNHYDLLNEALLQYRALGFQVALDDLGAGYSSLRLWKELLPDYIKVDKHFIRDVHVNKLKQSFVNGLLEISAGSNCRLIAEGVEKKGEFDYLCNRGIVLMQGYYFARPMSADDVASYL
ncbi:MAG: EAL domain-containing protein, partial [Pseudomonadota bacterium]